MAVTRQWGLRIFEENLLARFQECTPHGIHFEQKALICCLSYSFLTKHWLFVTFIARLWLSFLGVHQLDLRLNSPTLFSSPLFLFCSPKRKVAVRVLLTKSVVPSFNEQLLSGYLFQGYKFWLLVILPFLTHAVKQLFPLLLFQEI